MKRWINVDGESFPPVLSPRDLGASEPPPPEATPEPSVNRDLSQLALDVARLGISLHSANLKTARSLHRLQWILLMLMGVLGVILSVRLWQAWFR